MSTKIQINSLEALERLIGNDNELEMEIRNNIVQEFAKKHFKSLVNEPAFYETINKCKESLKSEVDLKITESIGEIKQDSYWSKSIVLKPEIKSKIDITVATQLSNEIAMAVQNAITQIKTNEDIESRIKKQIDYYVNDYIVRCVKEKLSEAISKIKI